MGCMNSKDGALGYVDDSVHVMLKKDKKDAKKQGHPPTGYVPRAEHPLLHKNENNETQNSKEETNGNNENDETKTTNEATAP
jgi:hypothetical protein